MHREVARTRVTPWPTKAGQAVILAALIARFGATQRTIAIGAFIGLALLMVIDWLVSTWCLTRRPVTVHVPKTMVVGPDRFRYRFEAPKGWGDLRLVARRESIYQRDSEFVTLGRNDESCSVESAGTSTEEIDFVRFRAELSVIGLVAARQWTTQVTPTLYRVPTPVIEEITSPSIEELGRLRTYVPGDRISSVSWGATARTGTLHVRGDAPGMDEVTMVIDAGQNMDFDNSMLVADGVAARAFAIGQQLLATGVGLRLIINYERSEIHDDRRRTSLASPRSPRLKGLKVDPTGNGEHTFNDQPLSLRRTISVHDEASLISAITRAGHGPVIPPPHGPHVALTPETTKVVQ